MVTEEKYYKMVYNYDKHWLAHLYQIHVSNHKISFKKQMTK